MSNFSSIIRGEIYRISRRTARSQVAPIKKDVAILKHVVSQQKRLLARLERDNARLVAEANERLAVPPRVTEKELRGSRIGPSLVRSQRVRLGLSRNNFARILHVSPGAVFNWETGKSRPRQEAKAALVAIRRLGRREASLRLKVLSPNGSSNGRNRKK